MSQAGFTIDSLTTSRDHSSGGGPSVALTLTGTLPPARLDDIAAQATARLDERFAELWGQWQAGDAATHFRTVQAAGAERAVIEAARQAALDDLRALQESKWYFGETDAWLEKEQHLANLADAINQALVPVLVAARDLAHFQSAGARRHQFQGLARLAGLEEAPAVETVQA
jgi:hypothetical protein